MASIEELRELAKEQFTPQEIESFITMGAQLAGKAVLNAALAVIAEGPAKGFSAGECAALSEVVKSRIPYDYSGYVECSFKEIPETLVIHLSIVQRDYRTDISVPSEKYAQEVYIKYNFLKRVAIAYWAQFVTENTDLFKRICDYRSDVDFSALIIDPDNPTTMYFDKQCEKRVGIFCYYKDKNGRPLQLR